MTDGRGTCVGRNRKQWLTYSQSRISTLPKTVLRAAQYRCNISSDRIYWMRQHCTRSIFSIDNETQRTYHRVFSPSAAPLLYSATSQTCSLSPPCCVSTGVSSQLLTRQRCPPFMLSYSTLYVNGYRDAMHKYILHLRYCNQAERNVTPIRQPNW
jgi:hypothetical protein